MWQRYLEVQVETMVSTLRKAEELRLMRSQIIETYCNRSYRFNGTPLANKLIVSMALKQFYKGKRLLLTGTTGFLGKVLLEKILYSLPEVRTVYILIRNKRGSHVQERFKKEIMSSPCFDRIRAQHQNRFEEFIDAKVHPIMGDLHRQGLGLSPEDYTEIVENCQIIMNCAASIDFNARLDQAIDSNIKGSLRMMELARSCQRLEIFTHVSTCYVNCNLNGLIREEIYDSHEDPQQLFQRLSNMQVRNLVADTTKLLGKYPNTYTYTKALCERLMKNRRAGLTLNIVRPAIINTSYSEPFPGWMDSIAAAAAYYMFAGMGIIKEVETMPSRVGDTVPVDVVVANIIVSSAQNAYSHSLTIYHVGSSDRNPLTWGATKDIIEDFWNANPSQSGLSKPKILITANKNRIKLKQMMRSVPIMAYSKISPFMGREHSKNAQRLVKAEERATEIKKIFHFFAVGEWIYECRKTRHMQSWLSEDERPQYLLDCADIDMTYFVVLNNYGIQKYILKENIEMPTPDNFNLLRLRTSKTYFSDIKWALSGGPPDIADKKQDKELASKILVSARVLEAIEKDIMQRLENSHRSFEEEKKIVTREAAAIVNELVGEFRMPVVRFLAWTLHKIFKRIYEKVNVNAEMFDTLRKIEQERKVPIVLLPTHRSYIDFLIVSYIFFLYQLKLPYIVSDEALMNAYLIPFLIRSSGAFFFRPTKFRKSTLYQAIFNEYIQRLLVNGQNLEFFLQGTRSRTGKTQLPRSEILEILIETVERSMVSDLCLVPLTINYEKVLEGDTFPTELLGEEKVEESLLRVVKAIPLLKSNFGRVYVEICDPIFLNSYLRNEKAKIAPLVDKNLSTKLGYDIIYRLNEKLVIMSTGVVSAVLLMHRKGISEDLLIKTVNELSKYIVRKGYKIGGINENSSAFAVRNAITYLETITVKTKKSIFELQIGVGGEFQKILMLSYYRNTIAHAFLPEAFLGCAFLSFGEQLYLKEGISGSRLREETVFLMEMLELEYLHPYSFAQVDVNGRSITFDSMMKELERASIVVSQSEQTFRISKANDKMMGFYCSLLRPCIESYWAVAVYLITIANRQSKNIEFRSEAELHDQVQWFIESFYDKKVLENYESCSLETIKNALKKYSRMGLMQIKAVSKKQVVLSVLEAPEKLNELENHLKNFLRSIYHRSMIPPTDLAKNTAFSITDLPRL